MKRLSISPDFKCIIISFILPTKKSRLISISHQSILIRSISSCLNVIVSFIKLQYFSLHKFLAYGKKCPTCRGKSCYQENILLECNRNIPKLPFDLSLTGENLNGFGCLSLVYYDQGSL